MAFAPATATAHAPVPKKGTHRQEHNRQIIRKVGRKFGLSPADIRALELLAHQESGWSSTSRTGRYGGLFQIDTKTGWAAKRGRWKNPWTNTEIAIKYIRRKYGTPRRALSHSYRMNWY
jgi:hypothetical protein